MLLWFYWTEAGQWDRVAKCAGSLPAHTLLRFQEWMWFLDCYMCSYTVRNSNDSSSNIY